MIHYIWLSNFSLIVFYLLYKLLFQQDTFLKWRRLYFWIAMLFSLIYPFIKWSIQVPNFQDISLLNESSEMVLEGVAVIAGASGLSSGSWHINPLLLTYCIGVLVLLSIFISRLWSI